MTGPATAEPPAQRVDEPAVDVTPAPRPERLDPLEKALDEIRDEIRLHHDRAAAREQIIERLHDENQRLRAGEGQLLLRPMLVDLQRLRNDLLRQSRALPERFSPEQMAGLLLSFANTVELTLERGGVRVLRPATGTSVDPARHRVAGVVAAGSPEDHGTVAELISEGYVDTVTERTLTPAIVLVSRWADPAVDEAAPPQP